MKKILKTTVISLISTILLLIVFVVSVNLYIIQKEQGRIISIEEVKGFDADCIIILGAGVNMETGQPSKMLRDRLTFGIELYNEKAGKKLLMSGDNSRKDYNEVGIMRDFAIKANVPAKDIVLDHAGFSTYESMYRLRDIFQAKKVIIVTQEYHLYRSLYLARNFGIDAYGVPADTMIYVNQKKYNRREVLSRTKDFVYTIFYPKPKYLGEALPITGFSE